MKSFSSTDLFQKVCKLEKKWGLYLSISQDDSWDEVKKAAPILADDERGWTHQIIYDGCGYIFFDSREEMDVVYDTIVGDDGPTKSNPYDGPARVYALTCGSEGQFLTENT